MALALNLFQTVTGIVSTTDSEVYTAPVGYTGVVLLAQVANIGTLTQTVTFMHRRSSTDTEIVKDFPIPSKDSATLLSGKLVLESGDKLVISGSNATDLKLIASILETLN